MGKGCDEPMPTQALLRLSGAKKTVVRLSSRIRHSGEIGTWLWFFRARSESSMAHIPSHDRSQLLLLPEAGADFAGMADEVGQKLRGRGMPWYKQIGRASALQCLN
jgi:hypothetical protein